MPNAAPIFTAPFVLQPHLLLPSFFLCSKQAGSPLSLPVWTNCPGLVWLISHHSGFSFITALYQNDSWSLVFNSHDLHAFIAINSFTPPPIWCCTVHWACTTSQVLYQWAIASVLCVAPLYRPPTLFWWFLVFACLFVWEIVSCNLGWPWAYCVFEDFWFWSVLLLSPKYCSSRVVICKHFTN